MFLGINLKKYKQTPEVFKNIIGLVVLIATIIFIFSILNIFTFENGTIKKGIWKDGELVDPN